MPKFWGLHMPIGIGLDAIDKQRVSIGWAEMGDLSKLPKDREAVKAAITSAYPDKKQGAIPVEAGVIFRFLYEIKAGFCMRLRLGIMSSIRPSMTAWST